MQSELDLARAAMIAKRFGGNASGASTGGEGTVRRKKKGAHKSLGGESDFVGYLNVARSYQTFSFFLYTRTHSN